MLVDQNKSIVIAVPRGDGSAHPTSFILEQIALRCAGRKVAHSITLKLLS